VPLSPTISTEASVGAALTIDLASSKAAADLPSVLDELIMNAACDVLCCLI
jgi:hypothetical protein